MSVGMAEAEAQSWNGRPRPLAILSQEALSQGICGVMLRVGPPLGVGQEASWRADYRESDKPVRS